MGLKRTNHTVYDTEYIWYGHQSIKNGYYLEISKSSRRKSFRKWGLINPEFEIEKLEIAKNHVHTFLRFPSRYIFAEVVGMLKSISASKGRRKNLKVRKSYGVVNFGKTDTLSKR
jgi:REP element-mobilizing transposase RayT